MAIEAPISKYHRNNILIYITIMLVVGVWFGYDGYFNQKFIEKHTENYGTEEATPDSTLVFNQKSPPFFLVGAAALSVYWLLLKGKKLTAEDDAIVTEKGARVAYDAIESIDKTHYDSKGWFVITYQEGASKQQLKLSRRRYDNMDTVLEKIIEKIS